MPQEQRTRATRAALERRTKSELINALLALDELAHERAEDHGYLDLDGYGLVVIAPEDVADVIADLAGTWRP